MLTSEFTFHWILLFLMDKEQEMVKLYYNFYPLRFLCLSFDGGIFGGIHNFSKGSKRDQHQRILTSNTVSKRYLALHATWSSKNWSSYIPYCWHRVVHRFIQYIIVGMFIFHVSYLLDQMFPLLLLLNALMEHTSKHIWHKCIRLRLRVHFIRHEIKPLCCYWLEKETLES